MNRHTNILIAHLSRVFRGAALVGPLAFIAVTATPAFCDAQAVVGVPRVSAQVLVPARPAQAPPVVVQVPPPVVQVPPMTVQVPPFDVQLPDKLQLPDKTQLDAMMRSLDAVKPAFGDIVGRWDPSELQAMVAAELDQARSLAQARPTKPAFAQPVLVYGGDPASLYEAALGRLDEEQWQRAVDLFDRVIKAGKTHVDGAMYWKAYALDRLGQRSDALTALQDLTKTYPNSRYVGDAKALEIEVKQKAGQPAKPEDHADEDLKLMAMNSLMQTDPDRAIPMLEQVLKGHDSPKVKQRALMVLGMSESSKARDVLVSIAKGGANPDLQLKAIRYLGMRNRSNGALLAEIYASSKDADVKREIIRSLGMAREVDQLLNIAKTEPTPELRIEAIRQLGMSRAGNQLFQLYAMDGAATLRQEILRSMIMSGDAERAAELAKKEADPQTRASAVRTLGMTDTAKTGDALVQIYRGDKDQGVKKAVMDALRMQNNAKALVDLARQESDPVMKKEIVSRLSTMKSKEATDYMLELLK